ncbi:MAG TPA: hypothetical protein VGV93_10545 [Acidimicrobiales bacterium]|nr:hypothetical protein [Acidimicrobiales bacterium]
MKHRLAAAAIAVAGVITLSAVPASAAHRFNVETPNGKCRPAAASATDNANDPAKEQSENARRGQETAAEASPVINGTGFTRCPS